MAWFNTVEFYVIAGTVAAAVVALAAVPRRDTPAVLHMAAGELADSKAATQPSLDVSVDDSRRVIITRHGLPDVGDDGAASLAVNVIGTDISIEERLTPGRCPIERRDTAVFVLDFLSPGHYHVRYNSEDAGVFAAFSLPLREGITVHRDLK